MKFFLSIRIIRKEIQTFKLLYRRYFKDNTVSNDSLFEHTPEYVNIVEACSLK